MTKFKESKNKTFQTKVTTNIEAVSKIPLKEEEKAEAIDQLDDLLDLPVEKPKADKIFVGYHPITGAEVWQ
jgi:hypothetical protein